VKRGKDLLCRACFYNKDKMEHQPVLVFRATFRIVSELLLATVCSVSSFSSSKLHGLGAIFALA
jgi:hypothetical protein